MVLTYEEFINNILKNRGRTISDSSYKEKHHIIPKCIGGDNSKDNTIELYAKEHFIAHKLLAMENPDNLYLQSAYLMMAFPKSPNTKRDFEITPDEYEYLRTECARKIGEANKGKKRTPEQKEKLKGRIPWNKGLTKENNDKLKQMGNQLSNTLIRNKTYVGENNPQYGNIGRISGDKNPMCKEEARRKVSESKMGDKNPMKNPEVAKRVADKNRGRKAYKNIETGKIKMFFPDNVPEGYEKCKKE